MKKNEDGGIITYQGDKGTIIVFVDENEYRKQERALRKYCTRTYKNLIFDVIPSIRKEKLKNGDYEYDLLTDKIFTQVYGKIKLRFFVHDNIVVIKNLTPESILIAMYSVELPTYKGVPYRDERDLFKIKVVLGGNNAKKKKHRRNKEDS